METVQNVLVFLHFVGLASLLGGFLVQLSTNPKVVNNAMLHGALLQLVTGIALVGVIEAQKSTTDETVNNTSVGIKLVVLLVITGLILVNRKKESVPVPVWAAIGGLTLLNIAVAVFVGMEKALS